MRRALILVALMVACAQPAAAQIARVQAAVDADTQPWITDAVGEVSFAGATTAGNPICVAFGIAASNRTVSSVTDDSGTNSYSQVDAATADFTGTKAWIYCTTGAAAATTVTVEVSSACTCDGGIVIIEISGEHASPFEDGIGTAVSSAGTTHDTGNVTAAGNALLFGYTFGTGGTYTIDADFSEISGANNSHGTAGTDTVTTGSYSMTNTSVGNETSANVLISIAEAAGGGGTAPPSSLLLLGVGGAR